MPAVRPVRGASVCDHSTLRLAPSCHAEEVGFRRPTGQQRATAVGMKFEDLASASTFPAPLVLPGDDLSFDPQYPAQSLRSWAREKERNDVTPDRNVLYLVGPPEVGSDVGFVREWSLPREGFKTDNSHLARPRLQDISEYLAAFYHGMPIKSLPSKSLGFTKWEGAKGRKPKTKARYIGLNTLTESVRIRARPSPAGVFQSQLNLEDLLDTAIGMLPDDAYALLMLVEQDLYEDEDDDFCCGRAYGGSRVAVVSMARYNPNLDGRQNVERQHAWPASHCELYVQGCCEHQSNRSKKSSKKPSLQVDTTQHLVLSPSQPPADVTPLHAAVVAHKVTTAPDFTGLWLSRVCQTASHELGHCFGMDHCVYYACVMQSTASLAEDVRQPPYLCPVDIAKVLRATSADEVERYTALLSFCEKHVQNRMFAAFEAWLKTCIAHVGRSNSRVGSRGMPIEL